MCRMLALIASKPLSIGYLQDFRRLAEVGRVSGSAKTLGHKDGWGVVHIDGHPTYLGRKALQNDGAVEANAATSQGYSRVCAGIGDSGLKGIFLVHLRKASSGEKVLENTAPFIDGDWVFSHNGTVYELGSEGVNDSRIFFKMLVEKITELGDTVEGVRAAVSKVRVEHKYSSMTFLLSDSRALYAYRDYTRDEDYYSLRYAAPDDTTLIFSQEETWNLKWRTIPNGSIMIADRDLDTEGPFRI